MGRSPSPLKPLTERLEALQALDPPGKAVAKAARQALNRQPLKDALSGTWLGHALHPLLTDVVIGSFLSATLLDVLGGDDDGTAARRLIAVGLASYPATAVTGVNDWADTEPADPRVRRVGLVHAAANATALAFYAGSLAARRAGSPARGKLLGLAGAGALAAAGYLGAHMTFVRGVGPNQTAFDERPGDWIAVAGSGDLDEARPLGVVAGDTPVLLLRHSGHLHAMHDRCSHRGCPLSDGEIDGEAVVCACHGSRFDLHSGAVERGPAASPQPVYEVRELDGRLEVRGTR